MVAGRTVADRFSSACARVVARLPFGLSAVVPATLLGFGVINGFTFGVDLAIVTVVHGGLGWPVPVAVSVGYTIAFSLSFVLNRVLNFGSHEPVGPEGLRYVGTVAVNFGVILLGVTAGLASLGVQYQLARLAAGACEGIFMYSAMRWFVFRRPDGSHDAEREVVIP